MLNIAIPPFIETKNIDDLAKNLKVKLECLYNPFYDYLLLHPSKVYPIIVNPMKKYNETFCVDTVLNNLDCHKVNTIQYNEYYPHNMINPKIQYNLLFSALKDYTELNQSKIRVLEFLEFYSITSDLDNVFCETTFMINNDSIVFLHNDGVVRKFILMCEFLLNGCKVSCSGSYMFFEDILTHKQYMYYGD